MSFIILMAFVILVCTLAAFLSMTFPLAAQSHGRKLPPGPWPLPIIGHLHKLKTLPHRSLRDLAQKYGPIMFLRLGNIPAVVVSTPEAARLVLKTHDISFANRPQLQLSDCIWYDAKGVAFTAYGQYWRNVRKLCTQQLLSTPNAESSVASRREQVASLVAELRELAAAHEVVDLSRKVRELIIGMSCRMTFGTNLADRSRLLELIHEALSILGCFNISDCLPLLAPLDIQGYARRVKRISKGIDEVFDKIITEHEQADSEQQGQECDKDFVGVLLSFLNQPMNPKDEHVDIIDQKCIKAILLDMIVGAFDTSATAIEWTLSELLKTPRVMKNLQEELARVIGLEKMVEQKDLEKLHYLDMVVKESFRLHPVVPFLLPRESMEDITIEGYYVPKKARIIINTWAIGRDPNVWSENVEEYYPERFCDSSIDLQGHDFKILPFGYGRRSCPGMNLGLITVKFVLAQLVHCFSWKLPDGMEEKDIDMVEKFGLSVGRANHLLAKPTYRLLN